MIFHNEWLKIQDNRLIFNGDTDTKRIYETSIHDIVEYNSKLVMDVVGDNPAFCLSGGIDSQAALQLIDKKYKFDVVTFEFEHGLNLSEVSDAVYFTKRNNITHKLIKKEILRFLNYDLLDVSKRFNITSPQFAVHGFFCEELKKLGYTGAIFGGNGLLLENNRVSFGATKAQLLDLSNYKIPDFPIVSHYLSYTQELCFKIAFNTPVVYNEREKPKLEPDFLPDALKSKTMDPNIRYLNKIDTYKNMGCNITPQSKKKTGFEQLQKVLGTQFKDVLYFEKHYRLPLYKNNPNFDFETVMPDSITSQILQYASMVNQKS